MEKRFTIFSISQNWGKKNPWSLDDLSCQMGLMQVLTNESILPRMSLQESIWFSLCQWMNEWDNIRWISVGWIETSHYSHCISCCLQISCGQKGGVWFSQSSSPIEGINHLKYHKLQIFEPFTLDYYTDISRVFKNKKIEFIYLILLFSFQFGDVATLVIIHKRN